MKKEGRRGEEKNIRNMKNKDDKKLDKKKKPMKAVIYLQNIIITRLLIKEQEKLRLFLYVFKS